MPRFSYFWLIPDSQQVLPSLMSCRFKFLLLVLLLCLCSFVHAASNTLHHKVIVITGASSGFGKGIALKLASEGATVVLAARRTQLLEEIAQQCRQLGGNALVVTTDVASEQDVERLAQYTLNSFGRIDVWINNAGVGAFGRFDEVPLADHKRLMDINFNGTLYGSYYAMRQFRQQHYGSLINIASVMGKVPLPYYASYTASKHAIVGLDAAINQELQVNNERNIHVTTIMPFAADTPWFNHTANYSGKSPRMIALDHPDKIINAVVKAIHHPKKEIAVGYKAKLALASHRISSRLTNALAGRAGHKIMIQDPPPALQTSGTLYKPMAEGTGIVGGIKQRVELEDQILEQQQR